MTEIPEGTFASFAWVSTPTVGSGSGCSVLRQRNELLNHAMKVRSQYFGLLQ